MGSKTITTSLKGTGEWEKMRTKLGPSAHLYRELKQVPSERLLESSNQGWAVN
jgi:hypothetical protein